MVTNLEILKSFNTPAAAKQGKVHALLLPTSNQFRLSAVDKPNMLHAGQPAHMPLPSNVHKA